MNGRYVYCDNSPECRGWYSEGDGLEAWCGCLRGSLARIMEAVTDSGGAASSESRELDELKRVAEYSRLVGAFTERVNARLIAFAGRKMSAATQDEIKAVILEVTRSFEEEHGVALPPVQFTVHRR